MPAEQNQPLWVLVHVPKDAPAGDYSGDELKADGWSAGCPLRLHVWNFALPEQNHVETAFGLSPSGYLQISPAEERRRQAAGLEMYLQSFAEHRISPYDPVPLDPIRVKFLPKANPPRAEVDFSAFDPAMSRAIEKYQFTNFRLPVQLGAARTTRSQRRSALFTDAPVSGHVRQLREQLESHLREKGWLKMAYTYWFDEPDTKDYAFVRAGMERLKKYAPGLQTMLTEQPEQALAGPIDIWCPISPELSTRRSAEQRRAHGERYLVVRVLRTESPYCTLFIDHPATELRIGCGRRGSATSWAS